MACYIYSLALSQLVLAILSLFFFRYSIFLFNTFLGGLISMIFFFGYDTLALDQMVEFRDGI